MAQPGFFGQFLEGGLVKSFFGKQFDSGEDDLAATLLLKVLFFDGGRDIHGRLGHGVSGKRIF
ncbi:MAG TPA: hypothetical protein VLT88_08900 [Desulfosarcina sp.]|nr:hypothetical protein [Desulfosarcina sp.]